MLKDTCQKIRDVSPDISHSFFPDSVERLREDRGAINARCIVIGHIQASHARTHESRNFNGMPNGPPPVILPRITSAGLSISHASSSGLSPSRNDRYRRFLSTREYTLRDYENKAYRNSIPAIYVIIIHDCMCARAKSAACLAF